MIRWQIGLLPRHGASRWRCWSCRAGSQRRNWPAGSDCRECRRSEIQIEKRFLERLEALPEKTRRLLLIAAAEPIGDPALLWRAADGLGIPGSSLEPAESDELVEIGSSVRFRHPLVRSAIYRAATPHERRGVHGALAAATDAHADPDRRAWHLAEATPGADENVAAELERAAGRAQARGGLAAAAAFLERAAALTIGPVAACRAGVGCGTSQVRSGLARRRTRAAGHRRRRRGRRSPARPGASAARSDRVRPQARRRRAVAAAERRPRARGSRRAPGARDLPRGALRSDGSPAGWPKAWVW